MKLPGFKTIISTDYPASYKALLDQLGLSINNAIQSILQALNGKLSIADNLLAAEKDITLSVDASGVPTQQVFISTSFGSQPRTLFVGNVTNSTNSSIYPTSGVFASWTLTGNGIQINHLTGLLPGNSYIVRIVVFG